MPYRLNLLIALLIDLITAPALFSQGTRPLWEPTISENSIVFVHEQNRTSIHSGDATSAAGFQPGKYYLTK